MTGGGRTEVRVLLVDDDPLVRSGLRAILDAADDVRVVGEASDGDEVVTAVQAHAPDVVLMDIRMRRTNGLDATASVRALPRPPNIVVLTAFDLDRYVVAALRAGASGFLLKDAQPQQIIDGVRTVASGDAILSPGATRTLLDRFADPDAAERQRSAVQALARLSPRQGEVADLVARGRTNAEISRDLGLTESTVKAYVSEILSSLGLGNRVQVALTVRDAAG
ncbi:response regulator transcription factor [Nocardioides rotundus]|nr:response regulator transcription factor [Nocardioides rotundus]